VFQYQHWSMMVPLVYMQLWLALFAGCCILLIQRQHPERGRLWIYTYIVALVPLYLSFIVRGPDVPRLTPMSIAYWTTQVSLVGLVLVPYVAEWQHFARLWRPKTKKAVTWRRIIAALAIASIVSTAIVAPYTYYVATNVQWLLPIRAQPPCLSTHPAHEHEP
jgi:membrane protease YdiL (CAAX protease family)